jgi:tetratricopeptide (TPR) repeat protein
MQNLNKNQNTPVIIYQMGKTGGKTVEKTLIAHNIPCIHVHSLVWSDLQDRPEPIPKLIQISRKTRSMLDNAPPTARFKIITATREPVSRIVSDTFQNMKRFVPAAVNKPFEQAFQLITEYIRSFIANLDPANDYLHNWFDRQIKGVLGLDVYASPFDTEKGYQLYKTPRCDILLLRQEDMPRIGENIIARFLGTHQLTFCQDNITANKPLGRLYRAVKQNLNLDPRLLKSIYSYKYTTHFYSTSEIGSFIEKWSDDNKKQETGYPETTAEQLLKQGREFLAKGNYHQAIRTLKSAAAQQGQSSSAVYTALARAFAASGQNTQAVKNYTKALRVNPFDPETVINCSQFLSSLGQNEQAHKLASACLRNNPANAAMRDLSNRLAQKIST